MPQPGSPRPPERLRAVRRLLRLSPLAAVCAALSACGPPSYRVSHVIVNPSGQSPLQGGAETVFPVGLVAPHNATDPPTMYTVLVETRFERDPDFHAVISYGFESNVQEATGHNVVIPSTEINVLPTTRSSTESVMTVWCSRVEAAGKEPSVRLELEFTGGGTETYTGVTKGATSVAINVVSTRPEDRALWNAPKPLEISCWRDSPIG